MRLVIYSSFVAICGVGSVLLSYSLGTGGVGSVVAGGRGEGGVVSPGELGLPGGRVPLVVVVVPVILWLGRRGLVGVVLIKSRPRPRFVCGVEHKSVLQSALVHYLPFLPERGAFAAIAWVKAKAVYAFVASQQLAFISFMGRRAFPAVGVLGGTIPTLVAKLVAPETSYWLPMQALRFDAFVEDMRTLFEYRVCRFWALVEDA